MIRLMFAVAFLGIAVPAEAQFAWMCPFNPRLPLAERQSPLDSLSFSIIGTEVKICYGRPSARGRTMIGGEAVPFGQVWRTGANETTKLMTDGHLNVAGIDVPAGIFALYTIPGEREWQVIVNRSHRQWGHESNYTPEIQAQDVGRGTVPVERTERFVETFTFRTEPFAAGAVLLILEWERTRIRIPVRVVRDIEPRD